MSVKVFYAWQSDRDQNANRFLIRDAIKASLKKLNADLKIQEAPSFEIDHDTKDEPGTPHIAESIAKKIRRCAVFVGDVTYVGEYESSDGRNKRTPNPNVMIELGLAIRRPGWRNILLVMNTAFGTHDDLPFDLKHHSFPIQYILKDPSDKEAVKAAKKALTELLTAKLKLIVDQVIAQTTALTRQQRDAEEARQRQRAQEKWEGFVKKFKVNFRGMITSRVMVLGPNRPPPPEPEAHIALSIIPLRPLSNLLDLGQVASQNPSWLRPMDTSGWNTDLYGKSLVHHNGRKDSMGRNAPTTVVEMTDEGDIFSATSIGVGRSNGNKRVINFERHERGLLVWIVRYVSVLRELAVKESMEIRLALKGCNYSYLYPHRPFNWFDGDFRTLTKDFIELGPVTIAAGDSAPSLDEVAELFRPMTTSLWRDAGLPRDPCFDATGKFNANPQD